MHRFVCRILAGMVLCGGFVCALHAQVDTGAINGSVTAASGSVVARAVVSVRNVDKGFERNVTTTDSGVYNLPALPAGGYVLTVSAAGFSTVTIGGVTVQAGQTRTLDQRLEIAATSTE